MSESNLYKGTFSLTLSTVIVKILGLIYKVPLASILGDEGMGYFNSAYTVYAFFYLICTAGVPKAVMILISEARAKEDRATSEKIVKVASFAFLILGLAVCLLFIILAFPLATLIGNSRSAVTMISIAPTIVFVSLAGVIRGKFNAEMRLGEIAVSSIIEGVGKLAFGLGFAMLGSRLQMPLNLLSAFTIFGVTLGAFIGLLYLIVCDKIKKANDKTGQKWERGNSLLILKRIFSISIPITLSAAVMSLTGIIDLVLVMKGLEKNGYSEALSNALYGNYTTLATPMLNLALALITPVSVAFIPAFAQAFSLGNFEALFDFAKRALRLSAFIASPITIGLFVYSEEILTMLFGNSSIDVGAPLLCLLCPAILFSSAIMIVNSILEAAGAVRAPIWSMLAGSIAKILLSFILIYKFDMGILAAPIGTCICYGISLVIALIIFIRRFNRSLPIIGSYFVPFLLGILSVLCSKIVYNLLLGRLGASTSLLTSIAFAGVIYLGLSYFTGIFDKDSEKEMSKYTNFA